MDTFLVTGGAGFIGSHLVEALLAAGHRVVVLDNFQTGSESNLAGVAGAAALEIISGDIRDPETVRRATESATGVFHLAANVSIVLANQNPGESFDINVRGTQNVLEAARRAGVKRVVMASSAATYGDVEGVATEDMAGAPISQYGLEKLFLEQLAKFNHRVHGVETLALRYFNVFGPRQVPDSQYAGVIAVFLDRILGGEPVQIFGDGEQTREFIAVEDVVRATLIAMTSAYQDFGAYNVTTGQAVSIRVLAHLIGELSGRPVVIQQESPRPGDIRESRGSPALFERVFGFKAQRTLRDGLAELIARSGTGGD